MRWTRIPARLALVLTAPIVVAVVWIALFGWNWLRGPFEHLVEQKTGRALLIQGDLSLHLGWPWSQIKVQAMRFADPPWAQRAYMVSAERVALSVDVPALFKGSVVLPVLHSS